MSVCLLTSLTGSLSLVHGKERQSHGFAFEQQVWNHLFERGYTDEWDIPPEANLVHPGIPVSVKYIRWGSSVYLGDAVRQREIDQPFELIVAFYKVDESDQKHTIAIHDLLIPPEQWERWWGSVEAEELENFGQRIQEGSIAEARAFARPHAAALRQRSGIFSINPKIDDSQRRIQCSIPFRKFYEEVVGSEPVEQEYLILWGKEWTGG